MLEAYGGPRDDLEGASSSALVYMLTLDLLGDSEHELSRGWPRRSLYHRARLGPAAKEMILAIQRAIRRFHCHPLCSYTPHIIVRSLFVQHASRSVHLPFIDLGMVP